LKRENLTENWQMGMRNWFLGKVPHNSDYGCFDRLKSIPLGYEYRLNTFVLNYFWFSS
jgi:hypothetical protein